MQDKHNKLLEELEVCPLPAEGLNSNTGISSHAESSAAEQICKRAGQLDCFMFPYLLLVTVKETQRLYF